jgi:hypothetical protein
MMTELDVLRIVSERLTANKLAYMLTGSFALAYYATPRMTRDIDIVVALSHSDTLGLVQAFSPDFYIDPDSVRIAQASESLFNMMHLESGIKVDLIVRRSDEYRRVEFERRSPVDFAGIRTWIVSREDLMLSKLVWARLASSELQLKDVRALISDTMDFNYLRHWAGVLGVGVVLEELLS